jgi:myo-inositol-1(or 4)-monophosphatase
LLQDFLLELGREAGALASGYFHRRDFVVERKADGSPVTTADLEVDRLVRERIGEAFPEDCILSEECEDDPERSSAGRVWIVDPIDGTSFFAGGERKWSILVSLCEDGVNVASLAHFPELELTLDAVRGEGCRINGRTVRVSSNGPAEPRINTNSDAYAHLRSVPWPMVQSVLELVRLAGGEYDGAIIRTGRAGEHDYAWLPCAMEEAGGLATDGDGRPLQFNTATRQLPDVIVASNGLVHDQLLREVAA